MKKKWGRRPGDCEDKSEKQKQKQLDSNILNI